MSKDSDSKVVIDIFDASGHTRFTVDDSDVDKNEDSEARYARLVIAAEESRAELNGAAAAIGKTPLDAENDIRELTRLREFQTRLAPILAHESPR